MRKKLTSLALALVMCLGLTVPAFAETYTETIGGITFTVDSNNATLTYTGSGKLTEEHAGFGAEYLIKVMMDEPGGVADTVSVNIGSGITADTQSLELIKEIFLDFGVKYVNINNGNSSTAVGQGVGGFTDVKSSDYFADPVLWAVDKKITAGTTATTFSPDAACTQGQILTFLWRAKGEPKPTGTVGGTEYYAAAAQWAKEQGLTDNFSAAADCTRAMVVTYLWKLAGSPAPSGQAGFTDVPATADYAQAVAWAVEQGITSGTSATTFSPDQTCTRGQIVTFLHRALAN